MKTKQQILHALARELAINSVDTSTITESENKDAVKMLLNEEIYRERYGDDTFLNSHKRVRNILIIGSGASRDANENIPTAWKVAKNLLERFKDKTLNKKELIDLKEKYHHLERVLQLKNDEFETHMLALSETKNEYYVRKELKKLLGYKYMTSLFYEIAGHMFKHRQIDVIINFNFDEIMDNIIDDEMGSSEYSKIYLNGHCPDVYEDLLINDKLRVPVYIKPHGTIRHLGSLKFTRQHYWDAPQRIKELLVDLFSKNYKESSGKNRSTLPVNIIAVGYGFNDFDFADILLEAYERYKKSNLHCDVNKYRFFVFDNAKEDVYKESSKHLAELLKGTSSEHDFNYIQDDIGQSFLSLWEQMQDNFKKINGKYFPRGIERHLLISELFHKPLNEPYRHVGEREFSDTEEDHIKQFEENYLFEKYLEKRILVELAMVIGKSEGVVHISQIRNSRAGTYCNLYLSSFKKKGEYKCLGDFLKKFSGLQKHMGYLIDTFSITNRYKNNEETLNFEAIFDVCWQTLYNNDSSLNYEKCLNYFTDACKVKLATINPDYKKFYVSIFQHIDEKNLLYSDTRWYYKFRSLFEVTEKKNRSTWNTILISTETGWILNNDVYSAKIKERNAKVAIVLADYTEGKLVKSPNFLSDGTIPIIDSEKGVRSFPWWLHNKHMFIFLDVKESGEIIFQSAIYYMRRLLSNTVNPLFLEEESDVEKIFKFFSNYWVRSGIYESNNSDKNLNDILLREGEKELLKDIYRSHYPNKTYPKKLFEVTDR